ncbi:uncharacterized protein PG998_015164 [Apiospora kogelbergensis]|uniref:uncharacterized protein n=1 Tax=Apiospora kogelbergensis TaxID=1337665 RepID=UPI00312CE850
MEEFLIGTGQIQLANLSVNLCRDKDEGAVKKLQAVFKRHCEPETNVNQISVKLWPSELMEVLASSAISLEDLMRTQPPFQRIRTSRKIECVHGRQRLEAAIRTFGAEAWWTVKIFCIPESSDPLLLLRTHAEQYHYETPYSDGHIYWKMRQYRIHGNTGLETEWADRLSGSKQKALKRLLAPEKHKGRRHLSSLELIKQLDSLMAFPGHREGFELGNVEKHLATRGRESMERFLERGFTVWDKISLQDEEIRLAANPQTVKHLQLRAPSASRKDREVIKDLMHSGDLFPDINNVDRRERILSAILGLDVIIPSIKTFHENMKYFSIGADILKSAIFPRMKKHQSLYEAMHEIWRCPSRCQVEYSEDDFREIQASPNIRWSYQEVFISAMRYSPWLSDDSHRRGKDKATRLPGSKDRYLMKLLRRARMQGFTSERIDSEICRLSSLQDGAEGQRIESSEQNEEDPSRRCGRPFINSLRHMVNHLFIPQLQGAVNALHPTTLFVQQDILQAFLGEFPDCCGSALSLTITDPTARQTTTCATQDRQATDRYSTGQPPGSYLGPHLETPSLGDRGWTRSRSEASFNSQLTGQLPSRSLVDRHPLVMAAGASARQHRNQDISYQISDAPISSALRTSFNTDSSAAAFSVETWTPRPAPTYGEHVTDYAARSISPSSRETRSTRRTFIEPSHNN